MDEIQTIYRKGFDIGVGAVMASGSPKSLSVVGEIKHVHNAPGTGGLFAYNEIKSTEVRNQLRYFGSAEQGCDDAA
jgi:hypothetical protein